MRTVPSLLLPHTSVNLQNNQGVKVGSSQQRGVELRHGRQVLAVPRSQIPRCPELRGVTFHVVSNSEESKQFHIVPHSEESNSVLLVATYCITSIQILGCYNS